MTRVVVLVENAQGALEALLFESEGHAIAWENAHPQVTDYIRGQAPLTGRRAVLQEAHRAELATTRSLSAQLETLSPPHPLYPASDWPTDA